MKDLDRAVAHAMGLKSVNNCKEWVPIFGCVNCTYPCPDCYPPSHPEHKGENMKTPDIKEKA